jgi:hypothetical protein
VFSCVFCNSSVKLYRLHPLFTRHGVKAGHIIEISQLIGEHKTENRRKTTASTCISSSPHPSFPCLCPV